MPFHCKVAGFAFLFLFLPLRQQLSQCEAAARHVLFREDRFLVQPRPGIAVADLARFHADHHCKVIATFPELDQLQVVRSSRKGTVSDLVQFYRANSLVSYAEPDFIIHVANTFPDDPKFVDGTLWALNNAGQAGGKPNADIDAPEAWAATHSASNIIVAIVDTGIRHTHEDLVSNIWVNPNDGSYGTNAVSGTSVPMDDNGHGTTIAGVIGASGNNGLGVVGVAWQVKMMDCKFADSTGYGSVSDAIACIEYARTHGAHIINASWGFEEISFALSNALQTARSAGILVVAAAGNNSQNNDAFPFYPASFGFDNIVSVAASTRTDQFYSLSNFGTTNVHLAAPGYQIYSTSFQTDQAYTFDEGTSIAAAFVTGSMALLRSTFPTESHSQLVQRLLDGTDAVPELSGLCKTGGRLNLRRALGVSLSQPSLHLQVTQNGAQAELQLLGNGGRNYVIETSSNLLAWNAISTNLTDFNGVFVFGETNLPGLPGPHFFRGKLVP